MTLGRRPLPSAPDAPEGDLPVAYRGDLDALASPTVRGPLESFLRHPLLALLPIVVLVGIALAVGLSRTPLYTAEARISVGRADVPPNTLDEVTAGTAVLAATYARAVEAPTVVRRGARAAGVTTAEAQDALSATHVPRSTLILVEAEIAGERPARRLANGGATGLIRYIDALNASQQDNRLIGRYRRAQRRTERMRRRLVATAGRETPSPQAVEDARLNLLTAQVRSQTLRARVMQSGDPIFLNAMELVVPATTASSDRWSVLSRLVLIALAGGILLGLALALLRSNAALLRRRAVAGYRPA